MLQILTRLGSRFAWGLLCLVTPISGCGSPEPEPEASLDAFQPRPTTDQPGARRFLVIAAPGDVPGVAEQPTARGRSIATLAPFGRRLFLGYGDYSENTGPVSDVSYNVESRRFEARAPLDTEELLDFQVHAGHLFVAELDPRGHQTLGSVLRRDSDGTWYPMPDIPDAVHTFGMADFGNELFVGTGSSDSGTARVAVTSDGGETWRDSHTTATAAGAFARYTHLGATSTELFASGRIHTDPSVPFAHVWDGERWDALSDLPGDGFLIPLTLGDELFVLRFASDRGKGGRALATYRRQALALVPEEPLLAGETFVNWSYEVPTDHAPSRTWVLTERSDRTQSVYVAENRSSWQLVSELPHLPGSDVFTSIAYWDDTVYLGTANGGFCAVEEIFELAGAG